LDNVSAAAYNGGVAHDLFGEQTVVWLTPFRTCERPCMKKWELSTPEDDYRIHSLAVLIGDDLLACLWGGTDPHIGAVAVALPRPSGKDSSMTSATASVLTMLGHKEDMVVKIVSETLSARLNKNVVVTAGIHWDHLDQEGIRQILDHCRWLAEQIAEIVEREG
jgi:hypothetical protein